MYIVGQNLKNGFVSSWTMTKYNGACSFVLVLLTNGAKVGMAVPFKSKNAETKTESFKVIFSLLKEEGEFDGDCSW